MEIKEIVDLIASKTEIQREEILLRIKNKVNEASGLLSEEGAAYVVASELGIKIRKIPEKKFKINELKPEMYGVNLDGKISSIVGVREFKRKGVNYKVGIINLIDSTGEIRCLLWNASDVDKLENSALEVGKIIGIEGGNVRKRNSYFELHVGQRSKLIENPDVNESDFPIIEKKFVNIKDIKQGSVVNVIGKVKKKFDIREFEKDSRKGRVASLFLSNGTSGARVSLWNEKADFIEKIAVGDILKIENAYARAGRKLIDLQIDKFSKIEINPEGLEITDRTTISNLGEGDYKEVRAAITSYFGDNFIYLLCPNCNKKIDGKCENCGEVKANKVLIININIDDGTATIRGTLFRDVAESLIEIKTEEADNIGVKEALEKILGKEMLFEGKIKKNETMDRLELNIYRVSSIDIEKEIENLLKNIA